MKNLNACLASLNLGLPDDVRRLKEAGYYTEAIACIDTYLAEDWTKTQNQPVQPAGPLPENPTPRGVDAMRDALLAQREILRRLPLEYTVSEAQALEMLQSLCAGLYPGGIPGTGPRRCHGLAVRGRGEEIYPLLCRDPAGYPPGAGSPSDRPAPAAPQLGAV